MRPEKDGSSESCCSSDAMIYRRVRRAAAIRPTNCRVLERVAGQAAEGRGRKGSQALTYDLFAIPCIALPYPAKSRPNITSGCLAPIQELWTFILAPRSVVAARKVDWRTPTPAWAALVWCGAAIVIILGLYGLVVGWPLSQPRAPQPAEPSRVHEPDAVRIADWGWTPALAIRLEFPEALDTGPTTPQRALLVFGFGYVELDNVLPRQVTTGAFPPLILGLWSILMVSCLYPPARVAGSAASFVDTARLAMLSLGYTALPVCLLGIAWSALMRCAPGMSRGTALVVSGTAVQIPTFVFLAHSYFASFSELFEISKLRLMNGATDHIITTVNRPRRIVRL